MSGPSTDQRLRQAEARVAAELPWGSRRWCSGARYLRLTGLARLPRGAAQAVSAASGDEELRGRLAWPGWGCSRPRVARA